VRRSLVLLLIVPVLSAGCGKGESSLAQVRGTVTYHGTPLTSGFIVFTPDADMGNSGPIAEAEIGPDGTFTLSTDGHAGAAPGWHRVTIGTLDPASELPARYRNPDLSGQSHEVKADVVNIFDIRLE
jgi:hypothetical protein